MTQNTIAVQHICTWGFYGDPTPRPHTVQLLESVLRSLGLLKLSLRNDEIAKGDPAGLRLPRLDGDPVILVHDAEGAVVRVRLV